MKQVLAHQLSFGIGEGWKGKVSQLYVSWSDVGQEEASRA